MVSDRDGVVVPPVRIGAAGGVVVSVPGLSAGLHTLRLTGDAPARRTLDVVHRPSGHDPTIRTREAPEDLSGEAFFTPDVDADGVMDVLWTWGDHAAWESGASLLGEGAASDCTLEGSLADIRSVLPLGDLDGDGVTEVATVTADGLVIWHAAGCPFSGSPALAVAGLWGAEPLVDLDGDGITELLAPSGWRIPGHLLDGPVRSLDLLQHADRFDAPWDPDTTWAVAADVDGDGAPEVAALVHRDGIRPLGADLEVRTASGQVLLTTPLDHIAAVDRVQALEDLDEDGGQELLLWRGAVGWVVPSSFVANGGLLTDHATHVALPYGLVFRDVDGDGLTDLIGPQGEVLPGAVLAQHLQARPGAPRRDPWAAGPVGGDWGDLDGDGLADSVRQVGDPARLELSLASRAVGERLRVVSPVAGDTRAVGAELPIVQGVVSGE